MGAMVGKNAAGNAPALAGEAGSLDSAMNLPANAFGSVPGMPAASSAFAAPPNNLKQDLMLGSGALGALTSAIPKQPQARRAQVNFDQPDMTYVPPPALDRSPFYGG